MKTTHTYAIQSMCGTISTNVLVQITKQKTGWFTYKADVLIKESIYKSPFLFVEPHFEHLANFIIKEQLFNIKPNNITWIHHNPNHQKENPTSINNHLQIIPEYNNNKITNAQWQSIIN